MDWPVEIEREGETEVVVPVKIDRAGETEVDMLTENVVVFNGQWHFKE